MRNMIRLGALLIATALLSLAAHALDRKSADAADGDGISVTPEQ